MLILEDENGQRLSFRGKSIIDSLATADTYIEHEKKMGSLREPEIEEKKESEDNNEEIEETKEKKETEKTENKEKKEKAKNPQK